MDPTDVQLNYIVQVSKKALKMNGDEWCGGFPVFKFMSILNYREWTRLVDFRPFFSKGDNYCEFLIPFLYTKHFQNTGLL